MKCAAIIVAILVLFCLLPPACSLGLPENVLVVQNGASPVSMSIAAYYMAARSIPAGNLVTVTTVDSSLSSGSQFISPPDYLTLIEQPIRNHLSTNGLANKIQYIVLTKGVPFRFSYDPNGQTGGQCVDSMLSGIDLVDQEDIQFTNDQQQNVGIATINKYWRSPKPFTHAEYGGYLVTRLDGYSEADAKALVDRSVANPSTPYHVLLDCDGGRPFSDSSIQPKWFFLPNGAVDPNYQLELKDYNSDLVRASELLVGRPQLSVQIDQAATFVGSVNTLTGYNSWGSNDLAYSATTYHSLVFGPRSIVETAVSTSGRSMFPETGGQSQIPDLIAQGTAGAKGYVTEPYLDAVASPSVLFDLYFSGRNLAESYYAASRLVRWKDVILGDPLCHLDGTVAATVAAAKALPNGTIVTLTDRIVSAGTDDFSDRFYIEDAARTSGIMVYIGAAFTGITRNSTVTVRGILGEIDGERAILKPSIVGTNPTLGASPMRSASPSVKTIRTLRAKPLMP